tara:strand:+ start:5932 stop:6771 length:840 start_codon:yes stop_codon:yes gene_type:complete
LSIALLSVSSTSLVIRYLPLVPALTLAFWRMLIASIILWVYSLLTKTVPLTNKANRTTMFAGVFLGLHFACFFWGVRNTSIANATLLANTGPLFTVGLTYLKEKKISKNLILPLLITVFGVLIIQWTDLNFFENNPMGNIVSLFSGFCIANTYLLAKEVRKNNSTLAYGRSLFFYAAITIGFICLIKHVSIFDFNFNHIVWFLFLGVVPSILGHNSLNYTLKFLSPTTVATIPLGEPIIATGLALILFSEKIPLNYLVGAPFVFIGIFLIVKKSINKAY